MIQDIYPSKLDNQFVPCSMEKEDLLMIFDDDGRILVSVEEGRMRFPAGGEFKTRHVVYLFSLDNQRFFLLLDNQPSDTEGFRFLNIREVRDLCSGPEVYAAFTGYHLWKWYSDNRYCGKCKGRLRPVKHERALHCRKCGNTVYPRINPAVIVGVIKGDSILVTRYREGYAHNALIAGFTEIGETVEETVRREVMEETGIKVKNIRYYKSQPWGMAQDVLMGFYCEADGDSEIHMDENELRYAQWVKREDIVLQPNNLSLTNEMMMMFRDHNEDK